MLASLTEGGTTQEIFKDCPTLSNEDVRVVIAFAASMPDLSEMTTLVGRSVVPSAARVGLSRHTDTRFVGLRIAAGGEGCTPVRIHRLRRFVRAAIVALGDHV